MAKVNISYDAYTGDLEVLYNAIKIFQENGIQCTMRFDPDEEGNSFNLYGTGSADTITAIEEVMNNGKWSEYR